MSRKARNLAFTGNLGADAKAFAEVIGEEWRTTTFGCEIEYCGMSSRTACGILSQTLPQPVSIEGDVDYVSYQTGPVLTDGKRRGWRQEGDPTSCSVAGIAPRTDKLELISPVLTWADADDLVAVMLALRAAGGVTNYFTGGHIHVGASYFGANAGADYKRLACLVNWLHRYEPMIATMLGIHDNRYPNGYAAPMPRGLVSCIQSANGGRNAGERVGVVAGACGNAHQHGLNLTNAGKHGKNTIEYRYFNATLDPDHQLANIQLAIAITVFARNCQSFQAAVEEPHAKVWPFSTRENPYYDFRVLTSTLGLIGTEFKSARDFLTRNLRGDAGYKTPAQVAANNRKWQTVLFPDTGAVDPPRNVIQPLDAAAIAKIANWTPGQQTWQPCSTQDPPHSACAERSYGSRPTASPQTEGGMYAPTIWYYRLTPDRNGVRFFAIQAAQGGFWASFTKLDKRNKRMAADPDRGAALGQFVTWVNTAGGGDTQPQKFATAKAAAKAVAVYAAMIAEGSAAADAAYAREQAAATARANEAARAEAEMVAGRLARQRFAGSLHPDEIDLWDHPGSAYYIPVPLEITSASGTGRGGRNPWLGFYIRPEEQVGDRVPHWYAYFVDSRSGTWLIDHNGGPRTPGNAGHGPPVLHASRDAAVRAVRAFWGARGYILSPGELARMPPGDLRTGRAPPEARTAAGLSSALSFGMLVGA